VFVMMPQLNPDGVYRGHYRADPLGQNLNRNYINPSLTEQPSIYAAKQIVVDLHQSGRLFLYVDLHAHANKRGTFVYGNNLDYRQQVEYRLFPKLLSLNSRYFDYDACNFSEKNAIAKKGDNKEGAGRVALWKATGLIQCYTLECNFCCGPLYNVLTEPVSSEKEEQKVNVVKDTEWDQVKNETEIPKEMYNIEGFEEIGEAVVVSLLDLCEINPLSRIKSSVYQNLRNLKLHVAIGLMKQNPFRFEEYLRKMNRNLEKNIDTLMFYVDKGVKKEIKEDEAKTEKPAERRLVKKNTITIGQNIAQGLAQNITPKIKLNRADMSFDAGLVKKDKITSYDAAFNRKDKVLLEESNLIKAFKRPRVSVIIKTLKQPLKPMRAKKLSC